MATATTPVPTATTAVVTAAASPPGSTAPAVTTTVNVAPDTETLLSETLFRLTDGLPLKELRQMVAEAKDCEAALEQDIALLEKAANGSDLTGQESTTVDRFLHSEITPPDRFYAISALIGRLRHPLAIPLPPNSTLQRPAKKRKPNNSNSNSNNNNGYHGDNDPLGLYTQLLKHVRENPEYTKRHETPDRLLNAYRRLSNHRTAAVFRRPVNPKEAPGYSSRILFPIDLGLIRKMIASGQIMSWADLHYRLMQICHNCVKFNGRESEYANVTRDFEAHVEEVLLKQLINPPPVPPAGAATGTGTASNSTTTSRSTTPVAPATATVVATKLPTPVPPPSVPPPPTTTAMVATASPPTPTVK